ncbi:MAG TPA: hypothetical protein EYM45_06615 [Verrucomicrobia bacterium]|nr:hypothetical protein [Verrucomicrobiota bacterium]
MVSKIPNQPNQPDDGPGFAPARLFCCGLAVVALLFIALAKPAAQPVDGNAIPARLAKRSLLLDVHGWGERVLAVGERGHILLSTDGGKNWQQVAAPTRRTLTGVFLIDDQTAWAVGHQSVILKSGDGGETWAKANAENDPETAYLDILFLDAKTGFIVGSYGKFLSTSDGGERWVETKQDDDPHLSHIIPAPDGGLWLTGEFGTVRRSGDRAKRWEPLATPYEGTFFGTLPLAKGGAVVFGLRGNIFRSEDGKAWKQVESPTQSLLHGGLALADRRLVLTAAAGQLLVSADEGRSFRLATMPGAESATATSLWQAADGGVLLTSDKGVHRLELADLKMEAAK